MKLEIYQRVITYLIKKDFKSAEKIITTSDSTALIIKDICESGNRELLETSLEFFSRGIKESIKIVLLNANYKKKVNVKKTNKIYFIEEKKNKDSLILNPFQKMVINRIKYARKTIKTQKKAYSWNIDETKKLFKKYAS